MKQVKISDTTLCTEKNGFSFKEKIEIARQLERLSVNTIELPEIEDAKTDILFVKTISAFVKKAVLSVAASSREGVENAALALAASKNGRIKIALPVSDVSMEYTCHKKAPKMLVFIKELVALACEKCSDVEFCALDATRAEKEFLKDVITSAVECGAKSVTICDDAAEMLPDDFAAFAKEVKGYCAVPVSVCCDNKNGLANAAAVLSLKDGIDGVKASFKSNGVELLGFATMLRNCGENYNISTSIRYTELYRIEKQISRIINGTDAAKSVVTVAQADDSIKLDQNDRIEDVIVSVKKLGYDLSKEDEAKVYEEFLRVAEKKNVGAKELDAIVASSALQVPSTYKLVSYVVNSGNIISANAQITLDKNGEILQDICMGDGPIDAAFRAIDKIIGHHYELDDFQIQSVTEGKEAMGSAVVKLRAAGKVYSGNGISTDIIGASIRAYLNALNKIVYEEA